ncbi:hypothetical protein AB0O01_10415 [Streptomyces sp. NPDC093252]|uniref:hypothetical protein n=1 Tax=Streptomyces sp. NPDC093252 TaxID=3154980 RepID=UPI00343FFC69
MASGSLVRGMGSFFKECGHPRSRWAKCPHLYEIRYRSAAGGQVEESGFGTQDEATEAAVWVRLADVQDDTALSPAAADAVSMLDRAKAAFTTTR